MNKEKNNKIEINRKNRRERGSITVLVLSSLLFFIMFFMTMFMKNSNKISSQEKEIEEIEKAYNEDIELEYSKHENVPIDPIDPNIPDVSENEGKPIDPSEVPQGNKTFSRKNGKIDIKFLSGNTYNATNQANKPLINKNKMIPLNWNGRNWVITDERNWKYSYTSTEKKWANAMLTDGTYKVGTPVGTVVNDDQIGSMLVWIPRYAYKITYFDESDINKTKPPIGHSDARGITDLEGKTPSGIGEPITGVDSGELYRAHPVFENGSETGFKQGEWDKNTQGIWVAKFESSNLSGRAVGQSGYVIPEFKPNRSLVADSGLKIGELFNIALNFNKDVNSHMLKNSEWGAVAYLADSVYGNVPEINDQNVSGGGNYVQNVAQSTTKNVYGIYDMKGGMSESVAGCTEDPLNAFGLNNRNNSTKYVTVYEKVTSNSDNDNYTMNLNKKFGDAIGETSSSGQGSNAWYGSHSVFPAKGESSGNSGGGGILPGGGGGIRPGGGGNLPGGGGFLPGLGDSGTYFLRGGNFKYQDGSGIFDFYSNNGQTVTYASFRVACIAE